MLHFLSIVVTVLMMVDAMRRRPHWAWFLVIFMLPPYSAWIYLALVALPAWNGQPGFGAPTASASQKGPSIAELRSRVSRLRSIDHLVELAEALLERREVYEAAALAEEAFQLDAMNRRAAFVLGAARLALADFAGAERALGPLAAADPGYRDHEARLLLCEAWWHLARRADALEALRDLAQRSRSLPHRIAYARFLERAGEAKQARFELEEALAEHALAPEHVKKRLRAERTEAEQRLAALRRSIA